jgi:plasmid stabilization system protein ParE
MAPLTVSPKVRQDLIDIGDHIAKDRRANAQHFVAKLMDQCKRTSRALLCYVSSKDLLPGLGMAALDRYVIFFLVHDGVLCIERVCA